MLTYKRKLILTKAQQTRIDDWVGTCRFVYNMALEIRTEAYKNKQESVHKYELMKIVSSDYSLDTATESFHTLLQSNNLDVNLNYAIIRKLK